MCIRDSSVEVVDGDSGRQFHVRADSEEAGRALRSFERLFELIRLFRQLGTAQAIAVYINLFGGVRVGMNWEEALDSALSDSLADQLQVLDRDAQRFLYLYSVSYTHLDVYKRQCQHHVDIAQHQSILHQFLPIPPTDQTIFCL